MWLKNCELHSIVVNSASVFTVRPSQIPSSRLIPGAAEEDPTPAPPSVRALASRRALNRVRDEVSLGDSSLSKREVAKLSAARWKAMAPEERERFISSAASEIEMEQGSHG